MNKCRFDKEKDKAFYTALRSRVNAYFNSNKIQRQGNAGMFFKSAFMLALYLLPLAAMTFGLVTHPLAVFGLWLLMGLGTAGVGFSIQHDAIHGSYSKSRRLNRIMGYSMNLIGGNASLWRLQHNVLHHTYSNIHGADEDIDSPPFLRFHPHQKRRRVHRFQHIYVWFFYSLATLSWVTGKDFVNLFRYRKKGYITGKAKFRRELLQLIAWKLFYYLLILVLPLAFAPVSTGVMVAGFFAMHFLAGVFLTLVFQPAHVMPGCAFPLPNEDGMVENNWAVHQLATTTNFAPRSRIFSWFIGGLNYQVEHHLFSNVCHVHYPSLSKIVSETAEEFGIPYLVEKTWIDAIRAHGRMLRDLGRLDMAA